MSIHLLDTNVLIALAWPQHVHHAQAHDWFAATGRQAWASCPLTQLGFIRISSNPVIIPEAVGPREALSVLHKIISLPGHHFWPDSLAPGATAFVTSLALIGHRQVTDAYLLALAQYHKGILATLDRGVCDLVVDRSERARQVVLIS